MSASSRSADISIQPINPELIIILLKDYSFSLLYLVSGHLDRQKEKVKLCDVFGITL